MSLTMTYARVADDVIQQYRVREQRLREERLKAFVSDSGIDPRHLICSVEHGYPLTQLRRKAAAINADVIIVGKRGTTIVERFLIGSVALHLLADPPCDVLVAQ